MTPRLMRIKEAAEYVAMSESAFRVWVAPECRKIHNTDRNVAWLRDDLDAWIDRRAGIEPVGAPVAEGRTNPLDALP